MTSQDDAASSVNDTGTDRKIDTPVTQPCSSRVLKVRIPAVISPDGKWCAYGYPAAQTEPDWFMIEEVADQAAATYDFKRIWITAELPIPEMEEIEALAINAEER